MTYANQIEYDNAEPKLDDYQDEPAFAEFAEYVTLELLSHCDCQGLSSEILMIDLECLGGGYQMAIAWVNARLTEEQYRAWLEELNEDS
jgi:hypothetical protein